jgi:carbamoyl-phosphate synthase large subunit
MNILLTSVGRRVALLKEFRQSMRHSNVAGKLVTTDLKTTAPASFLADASEIVPRIDDPLYIDSLLDICSRYKIDVLIPLIDTELLLLAKNRHKFTELGVELLVSSIDTNAICFDKNKTSQFFIDSGVKTPKIYQLDEVEERHFPLIVKPASGSSSVGVHRVVNRHELEFFSGYVKDAIVQELIVGEEYTIDVLLDLHGKVLSIVPRLRMETRAGEVSKGRTTNNPALIAAAKQVAESLPGAVGCITIQCFLKANGDIFFIEINPRFGGGYPLSYQAGADFPSWIMQLFSGDRPQIAIDEWEDNLVMLRYDDAIFVKNNEIESNNFDLQRWDIKVKPERTVVSKK